MSRPRRFNWKPRDFEPADRYTTPRPADPDAARPLGAIPPVRPTRPADPAPVRPTPPIPESLAQYASEIKAGLELADRRRQELANSWGNPESRPARLAELTEHARLEQHARQATPKPIVKQCDNNKPRPAKAGGLPVTFNPEIALAATRRQMDVIYRHKGKVKKAFVSYAPAWRAWAIARAAAAAAGTYGDIAISLFYQAAKQAGIPRRTIEHGADQARDLGWLRKVKGKSRPDRFIIAGQKALALDMHTRPSRKQLENIDTAQLAGAGWRAFLFAGWEETHNTQAKAERIVTKNTKELANLKPGESKLKILPAQDKILRPISRKREEELTKIDRFTAARYDRQAGVKREHNWYMTNRPASDLLMYSDSDGAVKDGNKIPAVVIKGEIAIRKADAREFAGISIRKFGLGKSINQALDKRGASKNSPLSLFDSASSARQRPGKVFCKDELEAEKQANKLAKDNQPQRDIYIPAGYTRGGARLWRLYAHI